MIQQEEKENLESGSNKQAEEAVQYSEIDTKARKEADKEEKKKANLAAEEARQKARAAEHAVFRAKEAEEIRQRANLAAETASQKAALLAKEADQKVKEAEEAKLKAFVLTELVKQKEKEAEEARLKAALAQEEARRREKQEAEAARQAKELAKEQAKKEAEEVKRAREQSRESEKAGQKNKKEIPTGNIIPNDNQELISGAITLMVIPGARYSKIMQLTNSLSGFPNIQIVSTRGVAGNGSFFSLYIEKPMPLYQVLYSVPAVEQITRKGNEIQVAIRKDE